MADAIKLRLRSLHRFIIVLALTASAVLCACTSPDSPEAQLRALIEQAETAAESKDLGELKDLVSERYGDDNGLDRQKLTRLLQFYFMRQQSIHLFTRIRSITLPTPGQARIELLVAMAGRPIPAAEELARLQADLFRFDLELVDEGRGAWKVVRAGWRRVEANDFL